MENEKIRNILEPTEKDILTAINLSRKGISLHSEYRPKNKKQDSSRSDYHCERYNNDPEYRSKKKEAALKYYHEKIKEAREAALRSIRIDKAAISKIIDEIKPIRSSAPTKSKQEKKTFLRQCSGCEKIYRTTARKGKICDSCKKTNSRRNEIF